jgi:hypothetical protein
MAYVDDSRVAHKLTEIELQIQETKTQLENFMAASHPQTGEEFAAWERELKALTGRLQSLWAARQLQQRLASETLRKNERQCNHGDGPKMKYYGYREVRIRFLGGLEIKLLARYYARSQARANKGKGAYFGLLLLGVHDRCSPALASEVAKLAAAMNSLEDARLQLETMGIKLSKKQVGNIAYAFSQRARLTHCFRIVPSLISSPVDLMEMLLSRHYQEMLIPERLDDYLLHTLTNKQQFSAWPLD